MKTTGLEQLLSVLKNLNMEIQFAYDPDSGLIGANQEQALLSLAKERTLGTDQVRLALPTIHDVDDLEISAAGMQAAAQVACSLAECGLLDQTGKVILEKYLVGMPIPQGEPRYFPDVKELRTAEEYDRLHFTSHPNKVHHNHPGHHLVTFSFEGKEYYYLAMNGDYLVPVFMRLKRGNIPFVFGDDSELAMGLRSDDKVKNMEAYLRRVGHFADQFFSPNAGMVIMIAGDMDFVDPAGVSVYQKDDKLYIQAVHADFKNSRYLQARLKKNQ